MSFAGPVCIGVQNGGSYGQMICNTILPDSNAEYAKQKVEIEANAKLIAAAPKLLKALTGLTEYFAFMVKDPQFHEYNEAIAAIKEATE